MILAIFMPWINKVVANSPSVSLRCDFLGNEQSKELSLLLQKLELRKQIYRKSQQSVKHHCFGHIFKKSAKTYESRDSQFSRTTTEKLPWLISL